MAESTGYTRTSIKDIHQHENNRTQHKWTCSKCETANNTNSRTCGKCRAMRTQAKQWKCGKCEKMMTNGTSICPDCNLDINGFSMDW